MLGLSLGLSSAALGRSDWYRQPGYAALPHEGGPPTGAVFIADFRRRRFAQTSAGMASIATATPETLAQLQPLGFADLFAFTRASGATYMDTSGKIVLTAADEPRFDWSGGTGALLLERPATNLLLHSQTLSASAWIKASSSLPGQTVSSGSLVLETVRRTGDVFGGLQQPVTLVDGTRYAVSTFLKQGDGGLSWFGLYNSTDAVWQSAVQINWPAPEIPLTLAHVSVPANGQRNLPSDIRVQSLGDGICRLSFSFVASSATGDTVTLTAQANRTADQTGNYFGGMQVEASPFATSYIPTAEVVATRAADLCRLAPTGEALLQRPRASLLLQMREVGGGNGRLLGGPSSRVLGFDSQATSLIAGSNAPLTIATGLTQPLVASGCTIAFDPAAKAGCYNGGDVMTLAATIDADRSATYLGRDGTGNFADGRYESLVVWPFRMSGDALQAKAVPYAG
jgi:hypothetical protein